MADGHFSDVELLRRELAVLILEWAGKAVKDDPDGPMSTALTRAVGEAARDAVTERHQALTAEAADRIAEALARRDQAGGLFHWRATPWSLGLVATGAAALLATAFLLGQQMGRSEGALQPPPTTTTTSIAPIAPTVDEASPPAATPPADSPRPAARAERSTPSTARPAPRATPREVGRPAPARDEATPRSTQPVGAAATAPSSQTPATTP